MSFPDSTPSVGPFRRSITVPSGTDLGRVAPQLSQMLATAPGEAVQIWVEDASSDHNAALESVGFLPYRDLWQMRRPLPADPAGIETTDMDLERDLDEFIVVNGRAFSWHPEQAHLTADQVRTTLQGDGFSLEGFRLLRLEGRLAGFCWTKIHNQEKPPVGEIYAIGLDPDFHGRGLGGPMTLAGLDYLSGAGLTVANLYVESDNAPAVATYERLGFHHHSTNRAYTNQAEPAVDQS